MPSSLEVRHFYSVAPSVLLRQRKAHHRIACIGIAVAIGYGIVDEVHQLLVAHRVADMADLAADGFGALLTGWGWWRAGARWPWF